MAWVDLEYYKNDYLLGIKQTIPDTSFPFYERQAEDEINWQNVEIENPKDSLKRCVCEVAELLYRKAPNREITDIIARRLSPTEYHNDFVFRGV